MPDVPPNDYIKSLCINERWWEMPVYDMLHMQCYMQCYYGDRCWAISPPSPPLKTVQMPCRPNAWGAVVVLLGQLINKHMLGAVPRATQQFCEMEDSRALPKVQKPLFLPLWPVLSQQYFDCSPVKTFPFSPSGLLMLPQRYFLSTHSRKLKLF